MSSTGQIRHCAPPLAADIRAMLRLLCLLPLLCLPMAPAGHAADSPAAAAEAAANDHPAALIVVNYLRARLNRQFAKAATFLEPDSLREMHADYVRRLNSPNLPFDRMQEMCRAVGQSSEEEIARLTPTAFYVAYEEHLQRRHQISTEMNQRIAETLEVKLLSVAPERPDLAHLLVRVKHDTLDARVQKLELISLRRHGEAWLVSLGAQMTEVTPLSALEETQPAPR
jgi:hypothetical protein